MKSYFRALAAACKTQDAAQGFGGISVLVLAIYAGSSLHSSLSNRDVDLLIQAISSQSPP